jgi:hypothetical protein
MQAIGKLLLTAFFTYGTHYGITKIYSTYCIPDGVWGFVQGSLTTGSPICSTIFNAMSHTQTSYGTIIVTTLSAAVANAIVDKN